MAKLPGDRPGEAADLLARCFRVNPNFVALFPDEGSRARTLPRMFAAGHRDASSFRHVYGATRVVADLAEDELLIGVANLGGDEKPDLAVMSSDPSTVSVLINTTNDRPTTPGGTVEGTGGDEVLHGTKKGKICGLSGDDVLRGLSGNNTLVRGAGKDVLLGVACGVGDDRLDSQDAVGAKDVLNGGLAGTPWVGTPSQKVRETLPSN